LTDNGIKYLSGDTDSDFFLPDIGLKLPISKEKLDKDAEAEEEKLFQDFGIKSERIHIDTTFKSLRFIRKRCRICNHG
jgi:preprotein translocase subunit SecA